MGACGRNASHRRRLSSSSDDSYSPSDSSAEEIERDDSPCPTGDVMLSSDSDDSSSILDEEFDIEPAQENPGSETDVTEEDSDIDVEDQALLWGGNAHSAEYYLKGLAAFNEAEFDEQDYSEGSNLLLSRSENQWKEYCRSLSQYLRSFPNYHGLLSKYSVFIESDPMEALRAISVESVGILYYFFDWILRQTKGKDGRKLRGTTKRSSLGTYWKVFRLVFERESGDKLDAKLNRKMHKVIRKLADQHGLSNKKRDKRCMTTDDLKEQIRTTLSTTEKSFRVGECRILCALFHQLMSPSGSRPKGLLLTRFGEIRVSLVRDPEGGPHRIAIRFTIERTKGFLGDKDANTFPLPEVLWDPCLLLSPHVFLLGVIFANRAFEAPSLTSAEKLSRLDIHPGEKELPLPLRQDLNETFVFRKAMKTLLGYVMSTENLPYGTVAYWIRTVGVLTGFKFDTISYNLRYNAAMEFDKSEDVSDGLRNLILQHADSRVLLKHYLSHEINADTLAITRGLKPQRALVKSMGSLGSSISKRRPTRLTDEQSVSVNSNPRVKELIHRRDELYAMSKRSVVARRKYERVAKEVINEKTRLRKVLRAKIRDEFDSKQAVIDIERQLAGRGFADTETERPSRDQLPAQKRLIEAVCAPMDCKTVEELYRRRDTAIDAVAAYCAVEEDWIAMRCSEKAGKQSASTAVVVTNKQDPPEGSRMYEALRSVYKDDLREKSYRCFLCVGKAWLLWKERRLQEDDERFEKLTHIFCTPGDVTKHFGRRHLSNLREGDEIWCSACDMQLRHKQHLQAHGRRIHGTVS